MTKTKENQTVSAPTIEFLAITFFGYACEESPAMAIQKAQKFISYGVKPKRMSKEWVKAQDDIILWMVPSNWHGTDNFCPVDEEGNPIGILLHGHYKPKDKIDSYGVMASALDEWKANK